MSNKLASIKNWKSILFISLGCFIILNNLIWIIVNGGRWLEPIPPEGKPLYFNDLNRVFGGFYMLFYFTIQTNLFLGVMFILFGIFLNSRKVQTVFSASVILITITFVLYWTAIAPGNEPYVWKSVYYQFYNVFTHAINPIFGFVVLICFRKMFLVDKRILGKCFMYIPTFIILNAILYGCGAVYDPNEPDNINGASVYTFLDLQHIMFINLSKMPALAWFINILLILVSPFIGITLSYIWLKLTRIRGITGYNSYYKWMERIKKGYRFKLINKITS